MEKLDSLFLVLLRCLVYVSEAADVTTSSTNTSLDDFMAPKAVLPVLNHVTSVDMCRGIDCRTGYCFTFQHDGSYPQFYPLCYDPLFYNIADCDKGLCANGVCRKHRCYCPPGTHGRNCEDSSTACSSHPCRRPAVCVAFSGGRHSCILPHSGLLVHHNPAMTNGQLSPLQPLVSRAACAEVVCKQGSTCTVFTPSSGTSFPLCYSPPSPLELVGCPTGVCGVGTCANDRCFCPPNVHGDRCETMFTGCSSSPCSGSSICITVSGGDYYCHDPSTPADTNTAADACSSNKCSKTSNCRCIPSCMHEFGYYCLSSEGYIGEHCDIAPPRVFCNDNNIRVEIPSAFLHEYSGSSTTASIYMSTTLDGPGSMQSPCAAVSSNGMHVITVPAFSTLCGSNLVSGPARDVVYSNSIWVNNKPSSLYDLPKAVVNFTCSYQKEYSIVTALKPVVDEPRPQISGRMVARTSISLCKISTCAEVCPSHLVVSYGALYTVAEMLHLSVNIDHPIRSIGKSSLVAEVMDAHLSCSSSRAVTDHVLLKEGCNVARELNCLLGRRNDRSVCMSFRVPRLDGCTEFYIHVRMVLCDKASLESYGCPDGSTYSVCQNTVQKRSLEASDVQHGVDIHRSVGPIIISSAHNGQDRLTFNSDLREPIVITSLSNKTKIRLQPAVQSPSASDYTTVLLPLAMGLLFFTFLLISFLIYCKMSFGSSI